MSNATAFFLAQDGSVIWSRQVLVPTHDAFDEIKNGSLVGGSRPVEKTTLQLKLPVNERTAGAHFVKIVMTEGGRIFARGRLK
jgi:hypothetical protein